MKAKKIVRSDYRSLFTIKYVLILLLSFIITLLIVIFTDIAEGETANLANQLYKVTYDDYQIDFH